MKKRVVLLNPPGREDVIRDYYCSHLAKGKYMWPPLDLLIISGQLRDCCDCKVIDAVVEKINEEDVLGKLKSYEPDTVICLVAAVTWRSDMEFLKKVRQEISANIVISGDFPRAFSKEVLKDYECIDAVLYDFTESGLAEYICENGGGFCHNIITRAECERSVLNKEKFFSYPAPQHELFDLSKYHLHHIYCHPFVPFLTTFGCAFSCTFCPFERIQFKLRKMDNIEEELNAIRSKGIREILLKDQSFGSHEKHAQDFCQMMENMGNPFFWSCEMRVDAAKEDLLWKMKRAGCHTVMFGVESANEKVLQNHNKGINLTQIREAFSLAKRLKLRTLAHVMIGMEGEDESSQEELMRLCIGLDPQYVSFNIAAPLWNTSFRDHITQEGRIFNNKIEVDSSYEFPVWESDFLPAERVCRLHQQAIRRFYFRPGHMVRGFFGAKSSYRRVMMFREGINLLFPGKVRN